MTNEQIFAKFVNFLDDKEAFAKFATELFRRKQVTVRDYVMNHCEGWGNPIFTMDNLIRDSFSFLSSTEGPKYLVNLQKEWHKECRDARIGNYKKEPKKELAYDSIW